MWRKRWHAEGWYSRRTCLDALNAGASEHPYSSVVFVTAVGQTTTTVAEIHRRARAVAAGLQRLGVRAGDAVAVQLTNRPECAIAYQAVLLCGAVLVPIVAIYGSNEVGFILRESGARVFIMPAGHDSATCLPKLADYALIPTLRHVVVVDDAGLGHLSWADLAEDPRDYTAPVVDADDPCVLIYTSGTTSAPKGVQHSHNSLLAEQATIPGFLGGDADDVQLVLFPPGHIAGVSSTLRPLISGSRSVFLEEWDPTVAADLVEKFGVTATSGAPAHLSGLLNVPGVARKLASLRQFLTGAATVTDELGRRAEEVGIIAFRCYGMTEHPTVTSAHATDPFPVRMRTDGAPLPGCSVRILDPDGAACPVGVDGEVVVRGPDQFIGYRDPALDAGAFTAEGWLRTGDLGHLDTDGRLTITDRIKDVIIRGGETISSGQVEDALLAHPSVAEAAAIAAPDDRYGEVVGAVVVLHAGARLDLEELRRHFAATGLARQKTPERLVIVDSLPRTALGEVRKAELRQSCFAPDVR